jgi:hypothetical protein
VIFDPSHIYDPTKEQPVINEKAVELVEMLDLNITETEQQLYDYELLIDSYGDIIRVDTEIIEGEETGQLITPESTPEPEKQAPRLRNGQNHSYGHYENIDNTQNSTTTSAQTQSNTEIYLVDTKALSADPRTENTGGGLQNRRRPAARARVL